MANPPRIAEHKFQIKYMRRRGEIDFYIVVTFELSVAIVRGKFCEESRTKQR